MRDDIVSLQMEMDAQIDNNIVSAHIKLDYNMKYGILTTQKNIFLFVPLSKKPTCKAFKVMMTS